MGYIGLLLNAPYKIDRERMMRLIWIFFLSTLFCSFCLNFLGYTNQRVFLGKRAIKCEIKVWRVLRNNSGFKHFRGIGVLGEGLVRLAK
jgi:hypothetical protein